MVGVEPTYMGGWHPGFSPFKLHATKKKRRLTTSCGLRYPSLRTVTASAFGSRRAPVVGTFSEEVTKLGCRPIKEAVPSHGSHLVEDNGIEPLTYCVQGSRSPS